MAPPAPLMPAYTPSALLRGCPGGKVVAIRASAVGAASAAPAPCKARAESRNASPLAKPPSSEPIEKTATPVMKIRRRP